MRNRVSAAFAVTLLTLLTGITSAGQAHSSGGDDPLEPPGLEGRGTHLTVLTTHEAGCTELPVVRAVTAEGARALVPSRYEPVTAVAGDLVSSRFQMWDYVCDQLSIDGQSRERPTQISLGAIAVATRDGAPVARGFYLLYLATDNPGLAARYRQVGLPATFSPDLSATVSDTSSSPFEVSFANPAAAYAVAGVSEAAPIPAPASGGPQLYYEGGSGEVLLSYENTTSGTTTTRATGDYREHQLLAPIIALPRLLQPVGAPFTLVRGEWTARVARL